MKPAETLSKIFNGSWDYSKSFSGRVSSRIVGNSLLGIFLTVQAYRIESGHVPDYNDAVVGGFVYLVDRAKNASIDVFTRPLFG